MDNIVGSSSDHRDQNQHSMINDQCSMTDPEKAAKFVLETGVDTFASFVGNVHGLYDGPKRIDVALLQRISEVLPGKFLSLHGGSGIPEEDIKAAINLGVVKINVNSELRVAFRDELKNTLETTDEVATYKIMPEAIAKMQGIVEEKIRIFGSGGRLN